jgi:hypothetical protein
VAGARALALYLIEGPRKLCFNGGDDLGLMKALADDALQDIEPIFSVNTSTGRAHCGQAFG